MEFSHIGGCCIEVYNSTSAFPMSRASMVGVVANKITSHAGYRESRAGTDVRDNLNSDVLPNLRHPVCSAVPNTRLGHHGHGHI